MIDEFVVGGAVAKEVYVVYQRRECAGLLARQSSGPRDFRYGLVGEIAPQGDEVVFATEMLRFDGIKHTFRDCIAECPAMPEYAVIARDGADLLPEAAREFIVHARTYQADNPLELCVLAAIEYSKNVGFMHLVGCMAER